MGPRLRRVDESRPKSSQRPSSPNDIPTFVAYHRAGGLTDADFAAMDEHGAEIAKIEGITDAGRADAHRRRGRSGGGSRTCPTSSPRTVRWPTSTSRFNLGKEGWNKISDPVEEIHDLTKIDGVDVYVGGFGGQAYDFTDSFDGSHVTPAAASRSAW